jgi:hypothetical protein
MRSRELAYTTLFFAVACVLIFSFAFVIEGHAIEGAASGILWVAVAFAGTLALGRAFERERQSETLRALLLAPGERAGIYVGKLIGLVALMACVEIVLVPMIGCCSMRRCCARRGCSPVCWRRARSASRAWARCSPPCSCAPTRATSCCRFSCIRLRSR